MVKLCLVATELIAREFPEIQKITVIVDTKNLSVRSNVDLAMFQEMLK